MEKVKTAIAVHDNADLCKSKKLKVKPESGKKSAVKLIFLKIAAGISAGLINGLFGGGGGMVIVPCLKHLLKYRAAEAHATALAVILPISVVSGIFYTAFGNLEWQPSVFVTIGVTVGGVAGAFLLKKLSAKPITILFSAVMAAAGVKLLFF